MRPDGQVSLQGEVGAFGIEDVLALVSAKSGALVFTCPDRGGARFDMVDGRIVAAQGEAGNDVVAVLSDALRFPSGGFAFFDGHVRGDGAGVTLADALPAARELTARWREIDAVIPSSASTLSLAAAAPPAGVHLKAQEWGAVVAIGCGAMVGDVAERIGPDRLESLQLLVSLVERGLVVVGAAAAVQQPAPAPIVESITEPVAERVAEPIVDLADVIEAEPEVAVVADVVEQFEQFEYEDEDEDEVYDDFEVAEAMSTAPLPNSALGYGNTPLQAPLQPMESSALMLPEGVQPELRSSSVESLARVLDTVADRPPVGGSADVEDRAALLKELEALRDGLRSTREPEIVRPMPVRAAKTPPPKRGLADSVRRRSRK